MIHETFKKFGYRLLLEDELVVEPIIKGGIFLKKNAVNVLDSLELTYHNPKIQNTYYIEFWKRREAEKNAETVFKIITEITAELKTPGSSKSNAQITNDTLYRLLKIEYTKSDDLPNRAIEHFQELKELGFHQSAYNILFQRGEYDNVRWNRDSLEKQLSKSQKPVQAWFEDTEP